MNRLTANLPDFQVKNFISGDFQLYLTGLFTGEFDTFTHHWNALSKVFWMQTDPTVQSSANSGRIGGKSRRLTVERALRCLRLRGRESFKVIDSYRTKAALN